MSRSTVDKSKLSALNVKASQRISPGGTSKPRGYVKKIQKKRKSIEKSYLHRSNRSKNMRNRSSMLELLILEPKNTIKLLLSSEIEQFDVEEVEFPENPYIFLCIHNRKFNGKWLKIIKNPPSQLEMCLSRSSRGLWKCSWALRIVIRACWNDWACF